jgi:hypothetical protein
MVCSCEDCWNDLAVYIRETVVAALEAVGEVLVIHAEKMEQRGVQIVNVHGIASHVVARSRLSRPCT